MGHFVCHSLFLCVPASWFSDAVSDEMNAGTVLGEQPHSQCSVHTPPLGTLGRCSFWLRNVGMSAFLTSIQGMPKLPVHGPHFEDQGCSEGSTTQVLSMTHLEECHAHRPPATGSVKSSGGLESPLRVSTGGYLKGFPGGKFQSGEGLLRPSVPGSGHPGTAHSSGGR